MPFGPTNAPAFYSAMMKNMKDEWEGLFIEKLRFLLAMKKRDSFSVDIVLNADPGVAEALRLRSFMIRSQEFL